MTNKQKADLIRLRLNLVLSAMCGQSSEMSSHYVSGLSFEQEMAQIREYIGSANELGIGYECIVSNLEQVPFQLPGACAIALLEAGLLLRFKTDREDDIIYDNR